MHEKALAEPIKIGMNHNQADLLFFLLCVNFDALETISKHVPVNNREYGELIAKLHIELGLPGKPSDNARSLFEHVRAG